VWQRILHERKDRFGIDLEHGPPVRECRIFDRAVSNRARGIDQNVEAAEAGEGIRDDASAVRVVPEISGERSCLSACCLDAANQFL
jgi:hypothetical protein